jgi:mono/diheme cytochrome c family protein
MLTRLPNKIVSLLIALGCSGFIFPTPPPFPPDLGDPDANTPSDSDRDRGPVTPDREPRTPENGRDLYIKECAICHGQKAEGTERGTPLYKPYKVYATHITRNGRKGHPQYAIPMPAYPKEALSDRQLVQIWDYLDKTPSPATGEDIYLTYCANCHGTDGRGGMSSQPLISLDGQVLALDLFSIWVRWGQDDGFYDSRTSYMPRWNQNEIADEEVEKVRNYIQSLSTTLGRGYVH